MFRIRKIPFSYLFISVFALKKFTRSYIRQSVCEVFLPEGQCFFYLLVSNEKKANVTV